MHLPIDTILAAATAKAARITGRRCGLTHPGRTRRRWRFALPVGVAVALLMSLAAVSPAPATAQAAPGWTVTMPITGRALNQLSCSTATNCVAVGTGVVFTTSDDGVTWISQSGGVGDSDLLAVSCATAGSCVALSNSSILATSDGGINWLTQTPPTGAGGFTSISCATSTNCVAVGTDSTSLAPIAITTSDGGTTWISHPVPTGSGNLSSVSCADTSNCWAVGVAGAIVASSDGGSTWATQTPPTGTGDLSGVSCPSASSCWAVGAGVILSTANGGTTWNAQTAPAGTVTLTSVSCPNTSDCWTVGPDSSGNAVILATTNSGGSWQTQDASAAPFSGLTSVSCANALDCSLISRTYNGGAIMGTTDGGTGIQPPPPPASVVFVAGVPLQVVVGKQVTATLGVFTYPTQTPPVPLSAFTAIIDWGDGTTSPGQIVNTGALNGLYAGFDSYAVKGTHRYVSLGASVITITVTKAGDQPVPAGVPVTVTPLDPLANFISTPTNPHQGRDALGRLTNGSIALLIPAHPTVFQLPVSEYKWEFTDGSTVYDTAGERPIYNQVLRQLAANPGDGGLLTEAIGMGILPPGADGGPLGIGGLSAHEVRAIVKVWQQEYPLHIIPHVYPDYGTVGVQLSVTDTAGVTSQTNQALTISKNCEPWGGNGVFGINPFAEYTTCDTLNGFQVQFGAKRAPDYIFLGDAQVLPLPDRLTKLGLGAAGSVQLVITHGVTAPFSLANAAGSVFLQLQLNIGAGVKLPSTSGLSGGVGWLGPPDAAQPPPTDPQINNFVNGFTLSAGASAGYPGYGIGFSTILNNNPLQGGEEWYIGNNLGIAAGAGGACAAPIPVVASNTWSLLAALFKTVNQVPPNPDPTSTISQLQQIWPLLFGTGQDILTSIGTALKQCVGLSP